MGENVKSGRKRDNRTGVVVVTIDFWVVVGYIFCAGLAGLVSKRLFSAFEGF